jgi:ribbon-helix-helix protein
MPMKIGKRIMMPIYLDPHQREAIKRLAAATRVPMSVYFREAVDDLLVKYGKELNRKGGKR